MAEQVKAGTYELVVDRWDELTSKPNEPAVFKRHRRGDKVRLTQEEAERLVTAGAVVTPGALERAAAEAALAQYQATLAALPDALRAQFLGAQTITEAAEELAQDDPTGQQLKPPAGPTSSDPATAVTSVPPETTGGDRAVGRVAQRPAKAAGKPAWVDFAVAQGADREDAAKLEKSELIARYGAGD